MCTACEEINILKIYIMKENYNAKIFKIKIVEWQTFGWIFFYSFKFLRSTTLGWEHHLSSFITIIKCIIYVAWAQNLRNL